MASAPVAGEKRFMGAAGDRTFPSVSRKAALASGVSWAQSPPGKAATSWAAGEAGSAVSSLASPVPAAPSVEWSSAPADETPSEGARDRS
jgi:hypothetical protein